MGERTEYWWVRYDAAIQPAEVGFVGGIPVSFRFIGASESVPAASAELIERLPTPPAPVIRPPEVRTTSAKPVRSGSLLWLVGILLLIFIAQCSGQIFDMIKNS
jgi:hypothetical protein